MTILYGADKMADRSRWPTYYLRTVYMQIIYLETLHIENHALNTKLLIKLKEHKYRNSIFTKRVH